MEWNYLFKGRGDPYSGKDGGEWLKMVVQWRLINVSVRKSDLIHVDGVI